MIKYTNNFYTTPPITPKNKMSPFKFCKNCGKNNHISYDCIEPIISNGIIGIYFDELKHINIHDLEAYLLLHFKKLKFDVNFNNIYASFNPPKKFNIKLLLIQRRHSIAYIEFLRGKYDTNNILEIENILKNMIQSEIENIKMNDFDTLWNNLWDTGNIKNKYHNIEYSKSKIKFDYIKNDNLINFDLIIPFYQFNEWGFPKGRRENNENNFNCAIREFNEETQINPTEYSLLSNKLSIRENLIGTNGFDYANNYFISTFHNSNIINIINILERKFNNEIGNISFFSINDVFSLLRPQHKERILIIKIIDYLIHQFLNISL